MPLFGFDEQFTLFGSTPLDNQFILEYMPAAKGDYVKVYLYGLMHCYHPGEDMPLALLAREMNLTEEEVMAAFRYWERKGLVRRVSDQPPTWKYISVKQRFFMQTDDGVDPLYADFAEAMYSIFGSDRRVTSQELSTAYEWVADMGLPIEVVLMLVTYCKENKGKHFSFKAAEKLAVKLAEEGIRTAEEAGEFFLRDEQTYAGARKVLRRLGKRREPSEDEVAMYVRWTREWGYTQESVLAACAETTKGEPTFAYLGGILKGMLERRGGAMTTAQQMAKAKENEDREIAPLKELLRAMNIQGVTINESTLAVYDGMRAVFPDDDVILLAGRECARLGKGLDDVMNLLMAWKDKGLRNALDVRQYIDQFKSQNDFVKELYEQWGRQNRPTAADRSRVQKWMGELGMSVEMIRFCAAFAKDAEKPMLYLDKVLTGYAASGVRTPEAAAQAHAAHQEKQGHQPAQPRGKVVREQQYEQRQYENTPDLPQWMIDRWKEMNGDAQ